MINNADGYYYASAAQKILYNMHQFNPRLEHPYALGTSVVTAFLVKFFHLDLDAVIFYLPAFISSLIVIPIILIAKEIENSLEWGFTSALLASIGWSFYNRTLIGYYDTDMFSTTLIIFIIYYLIKALKGSYNSLLIASILSILYPWLYDQGRVIIQSVGLIAIILFYLNKQYKFITLFAFALLPLPILIDLVLVILAYYQLKNQEDNKTISILAILLFLIFSNFFEIAIAKIKNYTQTDSSNSGLYFLNVNKTIREASHLPIDIIFNRIIGSSVGFILSIIGYLFLVKKHKEFLLFLPLWGIGIFAIIGGLRFTVYAVAIASMSAMYLFYLLAKNHKKYLLYLGAIFLLAPNISHIVGCCEKNRPFFNKIYPISSYPYLVDTTLTKEEVKILDKLKKISKPKDYAITWWDYGYPIWYYANINTLIDGGKHNADNFLVSKILTTSSPTLAYNLSKLSIKEYIKTKKSVAPIILKDKKVNEYLNKLSIYPIKEKLNQDIYLILPYRMLDIYPTISLFSNRDLNTNKAYKPHLFYKGRLKRVGDTLYVGNIAIDLAKAKIQGVDIKTVDLLFYIKDKLIKKHSDLSPFGLHLIILKSYQEGIIVDDYFYNSQFLQMFLFENYDKELFKPVILSPYMKVYKLK